MRIMGRTEKKKKKKGGEKKGVLGGSKGGRGGGGGGWASLFSDLTSPGKAVPLIAALSSGMGDLSVRGHGFSPRSRIAPHDGVRWWIVSNVVCGVGKRKPAPNRF